MNTLKPCRRIDVARLALLRRLRECALDDLGVAWMRRRQTLRRGLFEMVIAKVAPRCATVSAWFVDNLRGVTKVPSSRRVMEVTAAPSR